MPPREADKRPRLRLVSAPWASLYDLPVEAVIEEQDTHGLLGLDTRHARKDPASYPRLVHDIERARPAVPGRLLYAGGKPRRYRAILLDLDKGTHVNPIHLQMVAEALQRECERHPVRRLGMPLLGCVHGDATLDDFIAVFRPCLRALNVETLYLLVGPNPGVQEMRRLRKQFSDFTST